MLKDRKNKGITLVALVITIVILLVLAGISISALTNTGIFQKAKDAKSASENAEKGQNKILDEYETVLDQYNEDTLVYKVNNGIVKIGDYISYKPDSANTEEILKELETYSGSDANTTDTLKQEELKWRVLDVKDGKVRLISATPTRSKITLKGYNGYNNLVKLLDNTCNSLYKNTNLAYNVQNLKIEDIKNCMNEKIMESLTVYEPTNVVYPQILEQEEQQVVEKTNKNLKRLGVSNQNEFVIGNSTSSTSTLKTTYWSKKFDNKNDFKNIKYYELFIGEDDDNFYETYWMSSRCINVAPTDATFYVQLMYLGSVVAGPLCNSNGDEFFDACSYRPIVTLNSNVQLDTTKTVDGSSAEHAYEIK